MSVRATSAVWFGSKSTGTTKLVLLAIADCANDEGTAWPSVGTIARKCGLSSPRSVQNHVLALIELGELRVDMAAGRNGVNVYHLQIEWDGNSKKTQNTPPQKLAGGGVETPAESCTPPPQNPAPLPRRNLHPSPAETCTAPPQKLAGKLPRNDHGTKEREQGKPSLSLVSDLSGTPKTGVQTVASDSANASTESTDCRPLGVDISKVQTSLRDVFPNAPSNFMPAEKSALDNALPTLNELSSDDWEALRVWFNQSTQPARGCAMWPRSRMEFLTFAGDAVEKVRDWWTRKGRDWWTIRQKQQAKEKPMPKAKTEKPSLPSEDFYNFIDETKRPLSEAVAAWTDGRWSKEFNQWLFADFTQP